MRRHWKWATLLLLLLLISFAAKELPLLTWLACFAHWSRSLGLLGPVLYALFYGAAAMLCIPCMPLTLGGGFVFGPIVGLIAVHTGTALGAAGGFLASRHAARAKVARRLRSSPRFHFLDETIALEGWKMVGLLRLVPLNFGVSNYVYGLTGIDFVHYMLATIIAMLPGHIVFVYLGHLGQQKMNGAPMNSSAQWIAVALSLTATTLLTRYARRMLHDAKAHQQEHALRAEVEVMPSPDLQER